MLYQKLANVKARANADGRTLRQTLFNAALCWMARAVLLPMRSDTRDDPFHTIFRNFVRMVNETREGKILEIGARARSGNQCGNLFGEGCRRTGVDILPGIGVDVVADAHALSKSFDAGTFDAAFCISVFEHLGMPWKVALEMNRVLKPGGLVFVATHPAWPLHDRPWDFFRFSSDGLRMLFNRFTGFEVVEVSEGLPCRIIPLANESSMVGVEREYAYLGISMIARKIGDPDPRLRWDVDLTEIIESAYPR